jgi:hypothetical protein
MVSRSASVISDFDIGISRQIERAESQSRS